MTVTELLERLALLADKLTALAGDIALPGPVIECVMLIQATKQEIEAEGVTGQPRARAEVGDAYVVVDHPVFVDDPDDEGELD